MTQITSFDILDAEYEFDGGFRCPRVEEFPEITEEMISDGNPRVTELERITIEFDYPLSQPTTREFFKQGGFACYDFYQAVYEGYVKIYAEEEAAVGDPGHIPGMFNRAASHGPHGIWGHDLGDLCLEGFQETQPGYFTLGIGS
jgi:hypothetical protein